MIPFWRPKGHYVGDWMQLKNGDLINGYYHKWGAVFGHKFKEGYIRLKLDQSYSSLTMTEIWLDYKGRSEKLGYFYTGEYYDGKFNKSSINNFRLFKINKLVKEKSMANKLLSTLRLTKDQRQLAKVGVYDENGNLTEDGKEFLLNHLAQQNEKELVTLTKDLVKCKKDKDDDEK